MLCNPLGIGSQSTGEFWPTVWNHCSSSSLYSLPHFCSAPLLLFQAEKWKEEEEESCGDVAGKKAVPPYQSVAWCKFFRWLHGWARPSPWHFSSTRSGTGLQWCFFCSTALTTVLEEKTINCTTTSSHSPNMGQWSGGVWLMRNEAPPHIKFLSPACPEYRLFSQLMTGPPLSKIVASLEHEGEASALVSKKIYKTISPTQKSL